MWRAAPQILNTPLNDAELGPPTEEWRDYDEKWRRTLLIALPFIVLALILGLLLDVLGGRVNPFDAWACLTMAVGLGCMEAILLLRKWSLRFVVLAIIACSSFFFLAKLTYLLSLSLAKPDIPVQTTGTFYWVPLIYLLSFLIPRVRGSRLVAMVFTGMIWLVSAAYAVPNLLMGTHWDAIRVLVEINLADTVFLFMTYAFIGFKEGYTQTRAKAEAMEKFAYTDMLTGLPNRLMLQLELERNLSEARQKGDEVALVVVDVDGFKVINDTLGHEIGDILLKQVAQRLRRMTRREDFVARLNGDEFVAAVRDVDRQAAQFTAQKLQAAMTAPFVIQSQIISITASLGVSLFPEDAQDAPTLLRHANSAMLRVKRSGKNGAQSYSGDTDKAIERQRELERDLKGALTQGQLALYYHPMMNLATGRLVKTEALIRWHHPQWGLVSPADFIPLAEESGLIASIGAWVLREACQQAKAWQQRTLSEIKVAVNVSPVQFSQPGFFNAVITALEVSGLAPEHLELELTESAVMHEVESVAHTLHKLQRLGISIAIDDFGTGYSSLAYLRDLPIDVIKIDRSFVRDLGAPSKGPRFALALVQAIIGLASHLELEVVAEGIETQAQCELVKRLGCRIGQGYYFAKPMRPENVERMLQAEPSQPADHTPYTN